MTKANEEAFLSYKQAMNLLGLKNYKTLNRYIDAGLPVYVVGKSKRIKKSDILEFMEAHKQVSK
ncbi:helix-turn-helix domain-containing protein [Lactobacillus sp. AN1001]